MAQQHVIAKPGLLSAHPRLSEAAADRSPPSVSSRASGDSTSSGALTPAAGVVAATTGNIGCSPECTIRFVPCPCGDLIAFRLEEVELRAGDTVVGRSASCQITIDDPQVSRQHARFRVAGDIATVEDLGSRNGLAINGRPFRGTVQLNHNDRVRVGTQEIVFCITPAETRAGARSSSLMCHCAACGHAHRTTLRMCPKCGADRLTDRDTVRGVDDDAHSEWTLELQVQVIERSVGLSRWADAERMLIGVKLNIEERLASGANVERALLDRVVTAAMRVAEHCADARWARWVLNLHAALALVPLPEVSERLAGLPPAERASLIAAAERVTVRVSARGGPHPHEAHAFARLDSFLDRDPAHAAAS